MEEEIQGGMDNGHLHGVDGQTIGIYISSHRKLESVTGGITPIPHKTGVLGIIY